jgi:hypothetical protein
MKNYCSGRGRHTEDQGRTRAVPGIIKQAEEYVTALQAGKAGEMKN